MTILSYLATAVISAKTAVSLSSFLASFFKGNDRYYMFIGAPEEKHSFTIQDLGGVRVIF